MDEPSAPPEWPDRPLTESEAAALLDDEVVAVHVMDHDAIVRDAVDAEDGDVIEIVLETEEGYRMYSYAADPGDDTATWTDYGRQSKGSEGDATMRETLASYRVLTGDPTEGGEEGDDE